MHRAIERVRGFYDLDPASYNRCEAVLGSLKQSFRLAGYSLIDAPILEHLELYMRKNGPEVLSKIYGLVDQGRRELALRPEFTASVIRAMASTVGRSPGPMRVAYAGPVFRYEKPQRATTRQFTQAGVELLGEPSPAADADLLALACDAAHAAGVPDVHVVVGHLGPLRALLSHLSVDGYAEGYLLEHLEYFNRGPAQQQLVRRQLSLDLPDDGLGDEVEQGELADALGDLAPEAARSAVAGLLRQMGIDLAGSSRAPDEIIDRVLDKAQRHAAARNGARRERLERALEFCSALGALRGEPDAVLQDASRLLREYDVPAGALDDLREVVDLFRDHDLGGVRVTLAPGMARGIAYYSGLIFEMYAPASGALSSEEIELQICGGGRYDGLAQAITYDRSFPALGFAFGVERVLHCISPEAVVIEGPRKVALVLQHPGLRRPALLAAAALRGAGYAAVLSTCAAPTGRCLDRLRRDGYSAAAILSRQDEASASVAAEITALDQDEVQSDLQRLHELLADALQSPAARPLMTTREDGRP